MSDDVYICQTCKLFFSYNNIKLWHKHLALCPVSTCKRILTLVDDTIADIIMKLNLLQIDTCNSCEGHINDNTFYPYVMICQSTKIQYEQTIENIRKDIEYINNNVLQNSLSIGEIETTTMKNDVHWFRGAEDYKKFSISLIGLPNYALNIYQKMQLKQDFVKNMYITISELGRMKFQRDG